MKIELIVVILAVIAHFAIGFFIYYHNQKSYTNRFFLLFTVVAALWGIVQFLSLHQPTPDLTLDVIRWAMLLATLYSFTLYLTVHTFPSPTIRLNKYFFVFLIILSTVVSVLSLTNLVFSGITGVGATAEPTPGPAIGLFGLTSGFFIVGSIWILIARYRKAKGIERSQLQYLLIGVLGSALLMFVTNFLVVVLFEITSLIAFGPAYTLFFIISTAYAIVAHQLFDIRIFIKKTVVYSGLLLFAVAIYSMIIFFFAAFYGNQNVFDMRTFAANLVAAFFIALGFEPLRRWLVKVTDRYLFVGEYNAQEVIAEQAQTLTNVLDINEALQSMMQALTKALRTKKAATFILHKSEKEDSLEIKGVESVGYAPGQLKLKAGGPLITYFTDARHASIVSDEARATLNQGNESKEVKELCRVVIEELDSLEAAVALPIRVSDKLIGILIIGPKLSGDSFTHDDLQMFDIMAKQTASAIEKSRFYEDDQLKSEFVSIASHELLTPTAAIEGYLSMILDEKVAKVDPKAEEYLRKVQMSAKRLAELVTDLLSVSRIEGGRIVINKKPVEVSPIVTRVIDELKVKADQAKIKISYLAPNQPLPKVLADPDRIIQVLTNLISNAIKYNKSEGSITVSTELTKGFVTIAVADNGIGIAAEHLPHLFEKFYRVHDDSAAAEKIGTGLGLYITRSIVELMGGRITVTSQVGKGSTFSFTLPLA